MFHCVLIASVGVYLTGELALVVGISGFTQSPSSAFSSVETDIPGLRCKAQLKV